MTSKNNRPEQVAPSAGQALRRQAEEIARMKAAQSPENLDARSPEEVRRMLHELRVHQIELEMQNEELAQSRAQVEAGLRQYTDLYDFAPAGYYALAHDGAILQVNLAGANLLGVERGALINRRFGIFVSAESRPIFNVFLEKVFGSTQKETCEIVLQKDGSAPLWVRIETTANDGPREACRAVALDITERKRVEEKLLETNGYLQNLFNHANAPIIVWESQFKISRFNRAFEFLIGRRADEVIGKSLELLFPPALVESSMALIKKTTGSERLETVEIPILQIDGSVRTVLWNSATIFAPDGKTALATIAQGQDITERKRAEEQILLQKTELVELNHNLEFTNEKLIELDRIKSDFLSTVSHEIRTPIAIIREAVSLCLDGAGGKLLEKHSKYLTSAQNNIDRLTRLVTDLLDVSKIEQKKLKLRRRSVDLWSMTRKKLDEYKPQTESKGIRFELDKQFSGEGVRFYGDEDKILQILNNLLNNAIRNTESGGRITIRLNDDGDYVRFTVSDTGIGISKEDASKLFTKFQQIGRTDGPGYKGTGLGLAICRGLTEGHGGRIWVESELGKGSTFHFTLKKTPFPKILIVDDNQDIVMIVKQMLSEAEYQYAEAYDGEQAVKIAQNERINLIILDIQLPAMSGYEVIGRLKQDKRTLDIPILIMSTFSVDMEEVDRVSAENVIPMIRKPFRADALKEAVEEWLID
jgi:PAS domain S-box-containing protein